MIEELRICIVTVVKVTYTPVERVITGDFTIVRDAKPRSLIEKGPLFGGQDCINWGKGGSS